MLVCVISLCTVCFHQWQYYFHPQQEWVCLFNYRELSYLCVSFFFIFVYAYLFHFVVYNTVSCINTIIYFSMGKKRLKCWNNYKLGKISLRHYEVLWTNVFWFILQLQKKKFTLKGRKFGSCDLSLHLFSC